MPQAGKVLFDGEDIRKIGYSKHRQKNIALIFQNYNLINYMKSVENVVTALEVTKTKVKNKKAHALEILKKLGLSEEEALRDTRKLSGGQQQRVAIARAVAGNAPIILADEPTGNLDKSTAKEIIEIFKDLAHSFKKCVIVVTHSTEVANESDIILKIDDGKLSA